MLKTVVSDKNAPGEQRASALSGLSKMDSKGSADLVVKNG